MPTKTIAWTTGTGNITLTYTGQGDGTILVSSDDNTGAARSQTITIQTTAGTPVVTRNITINQAAYVPPFVSQDFSYTGTVQSCTLPPGLYRLQCWGAQGGSNPSDSTYGISSYDGGKGGYSEGILKLTSTTTVYIFVGGQPSTSSTNGGWNGGGGGSGTSTNGTPTTATYGLGVSKVGRGGGGTDIALVTSTMNYGNYDRTQRSSASLLSRFIVAGGGSGGAACLKRITTSTQQSQVIVDTNTILASSGIASTLTISSNKWYDNGSGGSYASTIFDVSSYQGMSCYFTVSTSTSFVFVKSLPVAGATPDYATGYTGYTTGANNARNIPPDAVYLSIITKGGGTTRTLSDISIVSEENTNFTINSSTLKWNNNSGNNYKTLLINVTSYRGKTCSFTLSSSTYYAFVTSYPVAGQAVSWASGTTGQTFASSVNKNVPSDASYLYILVNNNGSLRIPSDITISWTESQTTDTYDSQVGYAGGGIEGLSYSTYGGKQASAGGGSDASFGYGGNQLNTAYRYVGSCGGGGWYGGGNNYGNQTSSTNGIRLSGGGSGFVNIAENAQYRPSGYTGLELDSGVTYDGETSFPSTSGTNETGHSGDGYARITCVDPNAIIPLTFDILGDGTIGWRASNSSLTKTIQYRKNGGNWTSITSTTSGVTFSVANGDVVQFRGDNTAYGNASYYNRFTATCQFKVRGNIMSLINSTSFESLTTLTETGALRTLFYQNTYLIDASELLLPATTLSARCYQGLFNGCTNLTAVPVLPAATLASNAYNNLFNACSSLTYIKCLATDISASNCTSNWVNGVAATGTFVKASTMSSWTTGNAGIPSGWTVEEV